MLFSQELDTVLDSRWSGVSRNLKRVLCIQGPSTSGKSTLSSKLELILEKYSRTFFTLHLDSYYKSRPKSSDDYDFDNPGAFNWDAVFKLVDSIHNDLEFLEVYDYSYETSISSGPRIIKNPRPEYLIIEGIYAFYIFSKLTFDAKRYCPTIPNKDNAEAFVANPHRYPGFKVLNVLLTTCKRKMLDIRIARDVDERKKNVSGIRKQVLRHAWPATKRWVYNENAGSDILIDHGTFNATKTSELIGSVERHLGRSHSESGCVQKICEYCF